MVLVLLTLSAREIELIEFSGVRYHQLLQKSNVIKTFHADSVSYAYSFLENNSHSWYEDGWITLYPDYDKRLKRFIDESTDYELWITDQNGKNLHIPGEKYCVDVVLNNSSILVSPQHVFLSNKYDLFVDGVFLVTQIEGELGFTDTRQREFKHHSEIKTLGLSSEAFNTLKLKEIWMSHVLDTLNEYIGGMPYHK
jgi:hypothetical protein